ncbi:PREDICTED: uncharacterized protein LOC104600603 isoform X1 [Nelumbo nucifera]|nr:PREDICTED: uncharacterized protein LOC104600603 isoform X1 [Nelumbo nucifera]XP_010261949.1 PREDICTED: uncharacterized protein LOC104600603 isoform X1 [Nelumbo nucifera]
METLVAAEGNDEQQVNGTSDENISPPLSFPKEIADPVVYKLVRVEGDGRLVPATDDEVMEVEDLLEDDKIELPLVADTGQNKGFSSEKANLEGSEGFLQSDNAEVDAEKLNARLEYIEVMLQKVKQEERLRLSCASPDRSSDCKIMDGKPSDQLNKLRASNEKLQSEVTLQEPIPLLSPRLNKSQTYEKGGTETFLRSTDGLLNNGSSASAHSTSSKPDFSILKEEICLDNLSIKELHETFKATFGRETSVKDKLWLKRRIAMGLTNSCDVSTTTFIIRGKTLVRNKVTEENSKSVDTTLTKDQVVVNDNCKDLPSNPTNQMEDQGVLSGKIFGKSDVESGYKSEDIHMEERAAKRVRKPTRRYIEELSEVESRECSGRFLSSVKNTGPTPSSPKYIARPVSNVRSDGTVVVTRQDSLGGSGVLVPYVSRVRRGRPRKNFMALMVISKAEKEKQPVFTCRSEHQQNVELENLDSSRGNSDDNVVTVPTAKGGTRRKHHRAWTLTEVMKLVEGVSRYGAGRWSEIKRLAFASYTYRTSVDLKDKWRNLLRASFAQSPTDKGMKNSRKHASMPIPAPILLRVRELAEMHAQSAPDLSSGKLAGRSGRNVNEARTGYL